MAARTLRYIANAAQIQLKQLDDDKQIPFPLIVQWCGFFINKYRYEKGKAIDSGAYMSIYPSVPIVQPTTSTTNLIAGRKYIALPATIFDYNKDAGIKYISYADFADACQPSFAGVKFTRTTPEESHRLYMSSYEEPKPENPYFYRVGSYLYLMGIDNVAVASLEVGVITAFDPFYTGSLDTELDMGEEGFDYVIKQVLELGRFMMLVPAERVNDANAEIEGQAVPTQKITSVNQQPIQEG